MFTSSGNKSAHEVQTHTHTASMSRIKKVTNHICSCRIAMCPYLSLISPIHENVLVGICGALHILPYAVRGIILSTSGPTWDCTATKCCYSFAATSHFLSFYRCNEEQWYISPPLPPYSLSSLHFSATLSIGQSNQALEDTWISFWGHGSTFHLSTNQ